MIKETRLVVRMTEKELARIAELKERWRPSARWKTTTVAEFIRYLIAQYDTDTRPKEPRA